MPSLRSQPAITPRPATVRQRAEWVQWLHALQLYGAAAITAFGWTVCRLAGLSAAAWWPLWLSGALLAYNVDRLRVDPVDAVNVPARARAARRCRGWSVAVVVLATAVLLGLPLARRDWLTLGLECAGAAVCLAYSLPQRGRRLKDVPVLKTFVPPAVVAAAIFGLPWVHHEASGGPRLHVAAAVWACCFLLANMLLCDLRDLAGDRQAGTRSLPVLLGTAATRRLIAALAAAGVLLALAAASASITHAIGWRMIAGGTAVIVGSLLAATRQRRSEGFYEWWVEGMFFLPALALGAEWLWIHAARG